MILFASLLLPVFLIGYFIIKQDKSIVIPVSIGVIIAVLVCLFRMFFVYAHRIIPYSFSQNFIYYLLRQSVLPVFIIYGLFFLFSKDNLEYKIKMCFPLLISFYMVYLPYIIITSSEGLYSFYPLFVKPIVFLMMIIVFAQCIKKIFETFNNKKYVFFVLYILLLIIYLAAPAVFDALYVIDTDIFIMSVSSIVYCALPIVYFIFIKK